MKFVLKPFPQTRPKVSDPYLCQIDAHCFDILIWEDQKWFEMDGQPFNSRCETVIGWTEFPDKLPILKNQHSAEES